MSGKLTILGTSPPPIGGVTIHVKRLLEELNTKCYKYQYCDIRIYRKNPLKYLVSLFEACRKSRNGIVHYQLNNWMECALICVLAKKYRFRLIYTVHSFTDDEKQMAFVKRIAFAFCKNKVNVYIAPSHTIRQKLENNGIRKERIICSNTYVIPSNEEVNAAVDNEIIEAFNSDKKVVLGSASCLYKKNGLDVYGLDMCIEAGKVLKNKVKFVFVVPVIADEEYFEKCMADIRENGLEEDFCIYTKEVCLPALYKYCDVFVRPTISDSFGISVAEALDMGIPTVASDVCERAEGCILFASRDVKDFIHKVEEALLVKSRVNKKNSSCTNKLIELYESMI